MRGRLRSLRPALVALPLLATALAGTARADVLALVIGIDDYKELPKLEGAGNDARAIADALKDAGSREVRLLLDGAADRNAIQAAWKDLLGKAGADDLLVLTFAGHGGQEVERVKGTEADGRDETWLLAGFGPKGRDTAQRLPDHDLGTLLLAAAPHPVLVVADTSHAGVMARPADPRVGRLGVRGTSFSTIESDALPVPPPEEALLDLDTLDNVTLLAAAPDGELVPEVEIDGQTHGALSWAFVRAIRGGADADGNGVLSKSELERFVRENVRTRLEGRQHPRMLPTGSGDTTLIPALAPSPEPLAAPGMSSMTGAGLPPAQLLPLRIINAPGGDPTAAYARLAGTVPAEKGASGKGNPLRLTWDGATGEVLNGIGDVVATVGEIDPETGHHHLQSVVDKWALLRRLERDAERRTLEVTLAPNDQRHHEGDRVSLVVHGGRARYLTLIALLADGTVYLAHPAGKDTAEPPANQPFRLPLTIQPPFGADHYVAIASPEPLTALHRDLRALDGKAAADAFAALLDRHLMGQSYQLGVHGVYTGAR